MGGGGYSHYGIRSLSFKMGASVVGPAHPYTNMGPNNDPTKTGPWHRRARENWLSFSNQKPLYLYLNPMGTHPNGG